MNFIRFVFYRVWALPPSALQEFLRLPVLGISKKWHSQDLIFEEGNEGKGVQIKVIKGFFPNFATDMKQFWKKLIIFDLGVPIMAYMRFWVNLDSVVAWMSRMFLLGTGAISEV